MQEKRNKRLFVSLMVLIAGTLLVWWRVGTSMDDVVARDLFRPPDLKSIDRVVMVTDTDTVDLQYKGSGWMVNEQYRADAGRVEVLFATLLQAEPKRPVAARVSDSIRQVLERSGVKVTLYQQQSLAMEFIAGGNGQKTQAYFLKQGDETPYIMMIPGYRVYVSGIFELPEKEWRDKFVFAFNWRNFQSLEVNFPTKPSDGFTIELDEAVAGVKGLANADTSRVNTYLDDVSLLTVEEYMDGSPDLDSLANVPPKAVLVVRDIGRREYKLELYPLNSGHWIGRVGDNTWATFSLQKIRNILYPKSFFVRQETDSQPPLGGG